MRIERTEISPPSGNVIEGAIPQLEYNVNLQIDSRDEEVCFLMAFAYLGLGSDGSPLTSSVPIISAEKVSYYKTLQLRFPFPRDVVTAIESRRVDDVVLNLDIGMYFYIQSFQDHVPVLQGSLPFYLGRPGTVPIKYSQKEWSGILKKLGYSESWVLEISRPRIEGFHTVVEHLQKAYDDLLARNYEGCMANTRVAWDSLELLLKAKWEHIARQIDGGFPGEDGRLAKSNRIKELIDKARQWANVGVHREAYCVFPEDATLSYYITVSLMSYLSRWLRDAPSSEK